MEVVSCGKVTKIFEFPDLKLLSTYNHPNNLSSEIAIHSKHPSLLITHKGYGFNLVKVINSGDGKRNDDNQII
jgi:hypothetical protein